MEISRDMIRRHILSKQCTLWGRSGDTTQQSSLEGLVDWQYDTIKELLELAEAELPFGARLMHEQMRDHKARMEAGRETFTDRLIREQNERWDMIFQQGRESLTVTHHDVRDDDGNVVGRDTSVTAFNTDRYDVV